MKVEEIAKCIQLLENFVRLFSVDYFKDKGVEIETLVKLLDDFKKASEPLQPAKSLQECKESLAIKYDFHSWDELLCESVINEEFTRIKKVDPYSLHDEAAELYAAQFKTPPVQEDQWIRFEERKPEIGKEVWVVWPSGNYPPEYRKWNEDMDKQDWGMMRWLPVPAYPPLPRK